MDIDCEEAGIHLIEVVVNGENCSALNQSQVYVGTRE